MKRKFAPSYRCSLFALALILLALAGPPAIAGPAGGTRVQLRNQSPATDPDCYEYAADSAYVYYDCDDYGGQVCAVANDGSWTCQVRCVCYTYNSQGVCSSFGPPGCAT